jgi:hypothetical protein
MKKINIGDKLYHPCSIDIIEHKVIGIREYENFTHYHLKAINNVGACGKLEVIISENNSKLRFVELINEDNIEYSSGLQDFIEGIYYTDLLEAKLDFYSKQETLAWSNMDNKLRLYKEAETRYNQIKLLVNKIKEDLTKVN